LAEARAVFLEGCGLPAAWAGRRRFVVAELGFGTGLNILALADLWRRCRPPGGFLQVFSVEAHPLTAAEAARALARWPEIADLAERLLAQWPGRARGVHRLEFTDLGLVVDVAIEEVGAALAGWTGRADAWFLDGFSPALNPAMWRDDVLALVAARSAPGASLATFTVAGQVRRGLAAAGFTVERRPGFGRKRERLVARFPGQAPSEAPAPRVAIIGAGIAGAAAVRAVRALGVEPVVVEAQGRGAGASGNRGALVTPRLDAGLGPPARLFAQAFRRAVALYGSVPDAIGGQGVLQLAVQDRDPARFDAIAQSDIFEPGDLESLDGRAVTGLLGEAGPAGLAQHAALVVAPAAVLAAWTPNILSGRAATVRREGDAWTVLGPDEVELARADIVIVAAGIDSSRLVPELNLRAVRGQATFVATDERPPAVVGGAYVLSAPGGVLLGATHDRDDTDDEARSADDARNLASLAATLPGLAGRLAGARMSGRAGIRAATLDQTPVAGPAGLEKGLLVLAGLGSRGFSLAPLLGEHVAALALGAPSPLPAPLAALVDPNRFARRAARRGS
jgi:tRNA 5-methylaminomethyl-2-thiouridine biosynthesis bifunctional protein